MAYNNQHRGNYYNGYQVSSGGNGFANAPYRNNNQGQNQRPAKKHSGCRYKSATRQGEAKNIIFGWNFSRRRGMVSFVAVEAKESETKNDNYEKWVAKITFKDTGSVQTHTVFYNIAKKILIFKDLGMVANPNAPQGGYFGKFTRSN